MIYRVAENIFEIIDTCNSKAWSQLASHYDPFVIANEKPLFSLEITNGRVENLTALTLIYNDHRETKGEVKFKVYNTEQGDFVFEITQPGDEQPMAWLQINAVLDHAIATIDEVAPDTNVWKTNASLTGTIQLAYLLATNTHQTLVTHSSCIVNGGKAYLFQGKSGTGKSTHASLWLKNIPGSDLLNDDHPVIRINDEGKVIVYGSPWSGKTDCYRNLSAPLGAMVRIKQAPHNAIRKLPTIEAFASLMSTMFGIPFNEEMTDRRHNNIEHIILTAPCYELECLPDNDAAFCCAKALHINQ